MRGEYESPFEKVAHTTFISDQPELCHLSCHIPSLAYRSKSTLKKQKQKPKNQNTGFSLTPVQGWSPKTWFLSFFSKAPQRPPIIPTINPYSYETLQDLSLDYFLTSFPIFPLLADWAPAILSFKHTEFISTLGDEHLLFSLLDCCPPGLNTIISIISSDLKCPARYSLTTLLNLCLLTVINFIHSIYLYLKSHSV